MDVDAAVHIGLELLSALVRIETTPGAGRESEAARLLYAYAQKYGLAAKVHEPVSGRGSFVAIHAGPNAAGVLLHSHLDVAPAGNAADWALPPYSGAIADDAVWGRGTVDLKGLAAAHFAVMLALSGRQRRRSLVMASVAEEESAGRHGTAWLLANSPEVASCRIALGEGGGWPLEAGTRRFMTVQTGEKGVARFVARRTEHTGALPPSLVIPARAPQSAISLISRLTGLPEFAVARLPAVASLRLGSVGQRKASYRVDLRGMLYHDCQVLNDRADLIALRCHPLPGTSALEVVRQACTTLGLELVDIEQPVIEGFESLLEPATEAIMERTAGTRVAPIFTGGPSDNHWLRRWGMRVFGLFPGTGAEEVVRVHRVNERLAIGSFRTAVQVLTKAAGMLCEGII